MLNPVDDMTEEEMRSIFNTISISRIFYLYKAVGLPHPFFNVPMKAIVELHLAIGPGEIVDLDLAIGPGDVLNKSLDNVR